MEFNSATMSAEKIKKMISKDKLRQAIELLLLDTKNDEQKNEAIILSAQLCRAEKDKRLAIRSNEEINTDRNRIAVALLELLNL